MWVALFPERTVLDSARFLTAGTRRQDHIGEHRMMRENWLPGSPHRLSPLGPADFFFRHKDSRGSTLPEAGGGQAPAGPWQLYS